MDYSRFINEFSAERKPSALRELTKLVLTSPEPVIQFAGGFPNPSLFPFQNLTVTTKDDWRCLLEGSLLNQALQTGSSDGYSKLVKILIDFQKRLHNPPLKGNWLVLPTSGSRDALCKSIEMLLNPGDYIITEEFIDPGTIETLRPFSVKYLKVKIDKEGMCPDSLKKVLGQWNCDEIKNRVHGVPKVLYIVPTGNSPYGASVSAKRRREIYKTAQQYNLIILEDDSYYFLGFAETLEPSFLSMDVDGRVLRVDSFSKILTGGLRVGFVTGPQKLVERILFHFQCSQKHVATLIQIIVCQLLDHWGFEGFMKHRTMVKQFYENQSKLMDKYAQKWLKGLAEWNLPTSGMFMWVKVLGIEDSIHLATTIALAKKIACLPGKFCAVDGEPTPFIRLSFSVVTEAEMDKGFQRLAESIKESGNKLFS